MVKRKELTFCFPSAAEAQSTLPKESVTGLQMILNWKTFCWAKRHRQNCIQSDVSQQSQQPVLRSSNSMVITIEDGMLKRSYNHDCARPKFAIMNPELTYTLPAYQTSSGASDIMMHTMERYFTNTKDVDLIDRMAEGLLVSVREAALTAVKDPENYEARATLMWAGSLSHNGLTGTGRVSDFASSQNRT